MGQGQHDVAGDILKAGGPCRGQGGAALGGEQSGHMILSEYATTGDGILTSIKLAELIAEEPLSRLAAVRLLPQVNASIRVQDKARVLGKESVRSAIEAESANVARIVVRASGTEPVVRIFAEAENICAARGAVERVRRAIAAAEAPFDAADE